jgi:spore coat protein E
MAIREDEFTTRELISKAVCGRGKQFIQSALPFSPPHKPSTILGAWVINHQFESALVHDAVEVIGSCDLNLWYAYEGNTKTDVAKETFSYVHKIPLQQVDPNHRATTAEVLTTVVQEPNCVEATISGRDGKVIVRIELELQAELVAETKVVVVVMANPVTAEEKVHELFDDGDDDLEDLFEDEEDIAN